jgi:hypothetical protein
MPGFTSPGQTAKYQGPNAELIVGTVVLPFDVPQLTVPALLVMNLGAGAHIVAAGPADSGGMGFRLMRVPN